MTAQREITGKHVAIGTVAAFGVIVTVNLTMAFQAVGTFPGLEVKNSYVASQSFDARRAAQDALGWETTASFSGGEIRLEITGGDGRKIVPGAISARVGRPTIARDDVTLDFTPRDGVLRAPVDLGPGAWVLLVDATSADGVPFAKRIELWVN